MQHLQSHLLRNDYFREHFLKRFLWFVIDQEVALYWDDLEGDGPTPPLGPENFPVDAFSNLCDGFHHSEDQKLHV